MRGFAPLALGICAAAAPVGAELSFVAIGDWGGKDDEEPSTESQRLTSDGLARVALEAGAQFAVLLGDNFYHNGIGVATGGDASPRFRETFEQVYAARLPGLPFYAMLGNHDYGEGLPANISAQLAYAQRSEQWQMPSLWYKIRKDFEADGFPRSLEVIVLDTIVLCGYEAIDDKLIDEELGCLGHGAGLRGDGQLRRALAEEQWSWLEGQLRASDADYLWVAGHFPIWSAGSDGPTECLVQRLRPLLAEHGAHYISGHDHNLEHIWDDGVHMLVVGAGKECCYPPDHLGKLPAGALRYLLAGDRGRESRPAAPFPVLGGFASLRFGSELASAALHAHNGTELYRLPGIPRRRRRTSFSLEMSHVSTGALALLVGLLTVCIAVKSSLQRRQKEQMLQPPLLG